MRLRQGYTLVESIAVLAIVGILIGIATPTAAHWRDTLVVEQAARQIAAAHQRARIAAIVQNTVVVLTISGDSIVIRPRNDTTTLWHEIGPAAHGVVFGGPAHGAMFSPIGLAVGVSNATYTVTRGQARRSVIVSRLGRVRMDS